MKQCNALQEGYKAVCNHLESLEQSTDSKLRYERAFADISEYYESQQASSYSLEINAEYRKSLIIRHNSGDISSKKYTNGATYSSFVRNEYLDYMFHI